MVYDYCTSYKYGLQQWLLNFFNKKALLKANGLFKASFLKFLYNLGIIYLNVIDLIFYNLYHLDSIFMDVENAFKKVEIDGHYYKWVICSNGCVSNILNPLKD